MQKHVQALDRLQAAKPAQYLEFSVDTEPVPKGRPRFASDGTTVRTYTPARTKAYESRVRYAARHAMRLARPFAGALQLDVWVYLPIPKSWSQSKRGAALAGSVRPTARPDLDNLIKGIKDACNGIVWKDDSQVVKIIASKHYAVTGFAVVAVTGIGDGD